MGFVNEVVEGPTTGMEDVIERFELVKTSPLDRTLGDIPLLIESIEVAGDTPSEINDRFLRG